MPTHVSFLEKSGHCWTEWQKAPHSVYSREYCLDPANFWSELSVLVWFAAILKRTICSFGTRKLRAQFAENMVCCTEALIQKQFWQPQKKPWSRAFWLPHPVIFWCPAGSHWVLHADERLEIRSKGHTALFSFPSSLGSGNTPYPCFPISSMPAVHLRVWETLPMLCIVCGAVCAGLRTSFKCSSWKKRSWEFMYLISWPSVLSVSLDKSLLMSTPSQFTPRRCKLKQSLIFFFFFLSTVRETGIPTAV